LAKYLFEQFSDEYYRLINQTGVKHAFPPEGNDRYNACWDGAMSPDGTFYFSLASEHGKCENAKLNIYDYDTNEIRDCFYVGDVILPNIMMMPHSKLHSSINFLPDGRVIATTHSTDRAPQHTEWMPFAHHNHVWEGFPGSNILVYDSKTGKAENWGIPVPRESIYGAKYDPKHNILYMIGFMRGHVYKYSLDTKKVTDLGKAVELCCYRLAAGADGNIYGVSQNGRMFCINTDTEKLEQTGYCFPKFPDNLVNDHLRWLSNVVNHYTSKFMYMLISNADELFKFDFETQQVSTVGRLLPLDGLFARPNPLASFGSFSMIQDKYHVLWYSIDMERGGGVPGYKCSIPNYLMRWDIENGSKPECLGVLGSTSRVKHLTTEIGYDPKCDILYAVGCGKGFGKDGPDVLAIDLAKFRPVMYTKGPIAQDECLRPVKLTEEEIAASKVKVATEELSVLNPFIAFPFRDCFPIRIWQLVPHTITEESEVIGMCYDNDDILHILTGSSHCAETAKYVFTIKKREVLERKDFDSFDIGCKEWLLCNINPTKVNFDSGIKLPEAAGRRYRAVASAVVGWNGGRQIVGTMDALMAIVSQRPDEGKNVYSLGSASAFGPVRCMCTNKAKTKLWGVAGSDEDMGYVFYYDDETGLKQLGIINFNGMLTQYGQAASNVLSSIVLNNAEDTLAIGSSDMKMGAVYIVDLHDGCIDKIE
jgi:hypothetical protein